MAMELSKKPQPVQVTTLLTVIGEDAREVFSTFADWESEGDESKIDPVITKFKEYCHPQKNAPFERYCFIWRQQESGVTYKQYRTALRKFSDVRISVNNSGRIVERPSSIRHKGRQGEREITS